MRRFFLLSIGAGLLLAAPAARAQGVFNMGALTNTLAIPTGPAKGASPGKAASAAAKPAANLHYAAAGSEQETVQRFVARNKTVNPQAAQVVATTFAPGKESYRQLYRDVLTGSGFTDNDVASALGLYLALGYRVVHNIQDDKVVTPTQERVLRTQVARLLGSNPELSTPASAARVGEDLKLEAMVLAVGWLQARRGPNLGGFQNQVAQKFQQDYHLNLRQLTLTNQGLAAR